MRASCGLTSADIVGIIALVIIGIVVLVWLALTVFLRLKGKEWMPV